MRPPQSQNFWSSPICIGFVLLLFITLTSNVVKFIRIKEEDVEITLRLFKRQPNYLYSNSSRSTEDDKSSIISNSTKNRVLYTVTTLAEYNNGKKSTKRGSDRFQATLIPVITEGVNDMVQMGFHVDVYIICGFALREERRRQLVNALPTTVGLEIWDDALPMNYNMKHLKGRNSPPPFAKLEDHTRGLARQHRLVLKDKLLQYDIFVNFEDDMLIKGSQVKNYLEMTEHLYQLRALAPKVSLDSHLYFGSLTVSQLKHCIPGFMRVEAVLDEKSTPIPNLTVTIPVADSPAVDPARCCHVGDNVANDRLPAAPTAHQLITWEVQILPLGVRQMPQPKTNGAYSLDWVVLQRGTLPPHALLDYWSGNDGYYRNHSIHWRPATGERKYLNNQGGYMATRRQLLEWHTELCSGGFLPPFDAPTYGAWDGLDLRDVEYWSGGLQLIQENNACGLQRIISLDSHQFSNHILYHTANNKQEQQQHVRERFTRLDEFYGMLTTVKNNAIQAMPRYQNYTRKDHQDCNREVERRQQQKQEDVEGPEKGSPASICLVEASQN